MMKDIQCPACQSKLIVKRGKRKQRFRVIQTYQCKECGRRFEDKILPYKMYPARVIYTAINHYNLGYTLEETSRTVTGSFKVKNIGDTGSLLDWEITEWPEWGSGSSWAFTPLSGDNLTPEDGPVTVNVLIVAPDIKNSDFSGEVKIINKENSSDFCTIPVSLSTPVSQPSQQSTTLFIQFLQRLIQQFPILEQMFSSSPLYNRMLGLQ